MWGKIIGGLVSVCIILAGVIALLQFLGVTHLCIFVPHCDATPTFTATATSGPPPVINFQVSPLTKTWDCSRGDPLSILVYFLDNHGNVSVDWVAEAGDSLAAQESLGNDALMTQALPKAGSPPWATFSPGGGTVAAGQTMGFGVLPASSTCSHLHQIGVRGTQYKITVNFTAAGQRNSQTIYANIVNVP
jgi:hypothetical protein